jgi:hypothetical protein
VILLIPDQHAEVTDGNGTYQSKKHFKYRFLEVDVSCNEKIVGGRDVAIEHSFRNKNGRIHRVFFHCNLRLLLGVATGFDVICNSRRLS